MTPGTPVDVRQYRSTWPNKNNREFWISGYTIVSISYGRAIVVAPGSRPISKSISDVRVHRSDARSFGEVFGNRGNYAS